MPSRNKLGQKKQPKQQRSQETLQRIQDAALEILDRDGIEGLTTNRIAEQAGMSVASLYQFYPNKQAVVYVLYSRWLQEIDGRVEKAIARHEHCDDWRQLATAVAKELGRFTMTPKAESELLRAMWSHRDLLALDRKHNLELGAKVAQAMARFRPGLSPARLTVLSGFANEIFTLSAEWGDSTESRAQRRQLNSHAETAFIALWSSVLEA